MLHGRVVRPVRPGGRRPGREAAQRRQELGQAHRRSCRSSSSTTSSASSRRRSGDAIQAAAQLKVKWDETPKLSGNGNLASALKDPANLAGDAIAAQSGERRRRHRGRDQGALAELLHRLPGARADRPERGRRGRARRPGHGALHGAGPVHDALRDRGRAEAAGHGGARPGLPGLVLVRARHLRRRVSISAALLSQAVGKPVRVQFMRWDDHGWDQFGPAQVTDIRAGIDANGKIVGYDYASWQHGWTQVVESATQLAGVTAIPATPANGNADATSRRRRSTTIPNRRVTSKRVDGYKGFLKGIWLRAPAAPQSLFASEQMIDALAHEAGWTRSRSGSRTSTRPTTNGERPLDRRARRGRQGRRTGSRRCRPPSSTSGNVVKGRGVAIGGFASAVPGDRGRHHGQQEDGQDHRRPPLRSPGRRHDGQPGPRREPDGRAASCRAAAAR